MSETNSESEIVTGVAGYSRNRILTISSLAVLVGAISAVIAKSLIYLIDFFTNVAFYWQFTFTHSRPIDNTLGIFVVIIPPLGGIIIGFMALYGSKAIRGHGIPEAMEQILTNQSKIKPSIIYLKPLSAALSIGTGGPFGAEGPIISTGGALGSTIGQLLKITDHERKILLASGATAGMSAIFGSPIAAVFLAIELLLFEFSPRSIIPVALACITGAAGHHLLFGPGPVFPMTSIISIPDNFDLAIYSAMGIVIGLFSVLVTKIVYWIEDGFEKLPIHWVWWPALGGIVVGIVGYYDPRTLGVGYENITDVLSGDMTAKVVFSLCSLKFISWAVALGSGTSGGTLAPLLTIGGAMGALLGSTIIYFFPHSTISLPLAALVGMAAMFAGASRAVLTSVVFALETTGQSNALLPLLAACTASFFVSFLIMKNTIMTEKIARRGIKTPHSYKPDLLEKVTVKEAIKGDGIVLNDENTVEQVLGGLVKKMSYQFNYFIITNSNGEYEGIISLSDLYNHRNVKDSLRNIVKRKHGIISMNSNLQSAMEVMNRENVYLLGVHADESDKRILAILSYKDIIRILSDELGEHSKKEPSISLKRYALKIFIHGRKLLASKQSKSKLT